MRIHIIIDPHNKVESKLPEDMCRKWQVRCSHIELDNGFTVYDYREKTSHLLDMVMEKPRE